MEALSLFLGLLAATLAGAAAGLLAGLIPGVHVNTLALILVGASPLLLASGVAPLLLALVLVAATSAQAVSSGVPSAFLGAPDPEATASALPGHRLLHEGRGVEAADLHATGVLAGLAVALALAFPLRLLLAPHQESLEAALPYLLLAICIALLLSEGRRIPYRRAFVADGLATDAEGADLAGSVEEAAGAILTVSRGGRRVPVYTSGLLPEAQPGDPVALTGTWVREPGPWSRPFGILVAAAVFLLTGLLGLLAPRIPIESLTALPASPLFPLLTGLFAFPSLLLSLAPGAAPRAQVPAPATETNREVVRAGGWGGLFGALAGFIPGTSAAHAGIAALSVHRDGRPERTLLVLGAATGAATGFALVTFFAWGRARNGALMAARDLAPFPQWETAAPPALFIAAAGSLLLAAAAAYAASMAAARGLSRASALVPERALSLAVLALLLGLILASTGWTGLLLAAVATAVGYLPLLHGVRRSHAMGVILLPVTLSAWGLA